METTAPYSIAIIQTLLQADAIARQRASQIKAASQ